MTSLRKGFQLSLWDIFVFHGCTLGDTYWKYRCEITEDDPSTGTVYFMNDNNAVFHEEYQFIESGGIYWHKEN